MKYGFVKNRSLLFKLVISYILVLIIPLLIGSFVYKEAVKTVREDAIRNNDSLLEQTKQMMDVRLDEVDAISKQLSMDDRLITLMNIKQIDSGSKDYYKIYDYVTKTSKFSLTNNFIQDYFVYFKDNQWLVSSDRAYPNMEAFYVKNFTLGDMAISEFNHLLWSNKLKSPFIAGGTYYQNNKGQSVIAFVRPVMLHYFGQPQGVILILLKESAISSMLGQIDISGEGYVYVMDENNQLISQVGGAGLTPGEVAERPAGSIYFQSSHGEKFIVSETVSALNNWTYVSAIPADFVLSKVSYIRSVTLGVMFVTLILGAIVAIVLAYRNAKPLRDIMGTISDFFEGETLKEGNEYGYLSRRIRDLIHSNKQMQKDMDEQLPLLRMSFYRRLLHGEVTGQKEVDTQLRHIRQEIRGEAFAAVIIRIEDFATTVNEHMLKESEVIKMMVRSKLAEGPFAIDLIYDLDVNSLVIVMAMNGEATPSRIQFEVSRLDEHLSQSLDAPLFYAVGGHCDGLHNINRSFGEASRALEYAAYRRSKRILYYHEIPKDIQHLYYPVDIELKLIACLKSGDANEAAQLLEKLFDENIVLRELTPTQIDQWFYLLLGTLARSGSLPDHPNDAYSQGLLQNIQESTRVHEKFELIKEAFLHGAQSANEQRKLAKHQLAEEVERYIASRFSNDDLTLHQIASHFELTEAHLYTLIKEHTGKTFSELLEQHRIRHACYLLTSEQKSVKEIAFGVGYASDHSFRRAFKRVMGILPTEYVKALK
ncbi:helix-turn-helix domain-containing protein [Paenibacillus sp. CAU 1782]